MFSGRRARLLAPALAVSTALAAAASLTLLSTDAAQAATTTLCGATQTASVAGGQYMVQNNEWGSSASECITTDGNADFTVANSAISTGTSGAPGGYPSIYKGCHWGLCTSGSGLPIQVSTMSPGKVTTSWSTTQPGNGIYDVAYDIWYNQSSSTSGQPNAEEMMIWLNHTGSVQPSGSVVASNVSIGGHTYNVWLGRESTWNDVSYVMTSPTTSVSNLDIDLLAADSVSRGYMTNSDYLIDLEAGFELWQGGAGLATNSYSVNIGGGGYTPAPTTAPPTTQPPTTQPPSTPAGGRGCRAAYSVTGTWPGGFQGQVVVTNTGGSTSGWTLNWTYPGDQKISSLWNGTYSQSGEQITVRNAAYNGTLAPGGTTSVGFTGTYSSSDAAPSSVTCTAS
ncbi:cellulose binding domain-containing protein [Actinocrinis puniceicyclus]|uniref:Cellulose binding domain-containing protein n=1 Tax=Actinocrinis puniceicyclus TaxID=977794 RepID=A0A8J7WL83_9ACTN|nr:cellulose binding domain-containing protein [Actinocrinis puniceicyclus]MBS2962900.1 cellulose binding domain-containing protein [Actinocrinis puniceicyclus]